MNCTRSITAHSLSRQSAAQLLKSLNVNLSTAAARPAIVSLRQQYVPYSRKFSASRPALIKEFFPAADAPSIRKTETAWQHPIYTEEQMTAVQVAHRKAETTSDYVAVSLLRTLRWGLDLVTGYKHDPEVASGTRDPKDAQRSKSGMTERKWLIR